MPSTVVKWSLFILVLFTYQETVECSKHADQLYEDLMYFYNKNVRPVVNTSEAQRVQFGAALIRIIDVDEINQVLTTNLWLEMRWYDYKLVWDPAKFDNIMKLHIPSDQIWIPDILLYNNADGEPHISIMSDAIVYHTGLVVWKPPSIYKSFCSIDIEYYPYDLQRCEMKFGGWSYHGFLMNVEQLPSRPEDKIETLLDDDGKEFQLLKQGMDLSNFVRSLEWDLLELTSKRHVELYPGCCGQDFYIDVTFELAIRRKTLFYTVNLVTPCALIAVLTLFVFYIPAIEHKITHSISVLVSLTVFYLVLIELIPPTSLVIPLIGQYILFTMFMVSFSIIISVVTVNWYRRDGTLHTMPTWIYLIFVQTLPKILFMDPPPDDDDEKSETDASMTDSQTMANSSRRDSPYFASVTQLADAELRLSQLAHLRGLHPDIIRRMIDNVVFISNHYKNVQKKDKISDLWSYVAMVTDRLMLIVFATVFCIGTIFLFVRSPYFMDATEPIKQQIATKPLSGDTFEPELRGLNLTSMI